GRGARHALGILKRPIPTGRTAPLRQLANNRIAPICSPWQLCLAGGRMTLVFYRKRAFGSGDGGTRWRAFDKTVSRKPFAGAANAAYGFSIHFRPEIFARSGIR